MRNVWTIAKREFKHYFASPIAYLLAFVILLLIGIYFFYYLYFVANSFGQVPPPDVRAITGLLVFLLVFTVPALTMRTISEESRSGTLELLLTAPVRDWELVLGKWLGAFLFILVVIALTWIYPLILNSIVEPGIDQGPLISGYLGIVLVSGALLGIGVMISSFFSNQVAALLTTYGVVFLLWYLMGIASQVIPAPGNTLVTYLDMNRHANANLISGVIDLSDVVYFLSVTAVSIFIGSLAVEYRRWR